jgi:hypothetical protein
MPTKRTYRPRVAGQDQLSAGARWFLEDRGEVESIDALGLWEANEACWLYRNDDKPFGLMGDGARRVSGLSARELVERYGADALKEYQAEHGRDRFPEWWHRFNG